MLTIVLTSANLLLEVEGGALQQNPQQVVRVPGETVRPRHALEPPQPRRAGHEQAAAPRSLQGILVTLGGGEGTYVDMEPDAVLLADVRDGVDGVEGPEDGGARGAVHEEGAAALRQVLGDQLLEVLGPHPPAAVHLDLAAVVRAQPQRGRRALHRVVALHRRRG